MKFRAQTASEEFSNFHIQNSEFYYHFDRSSDIQLPLVSIASYRVLIFVLILSHPSTPRSLKWFCLSGFRNEMLCIYISFRPHYGPGVDSASNRNEYQEYFLGVKAAGA